ncbi:hypothetical protein C8R43DRAFT_1036539 [Mycena crocata]|nr:hypothetical protein C8R43DRAFT_1036539 [Mycena crocata]
MFLTLSSPSPVNAVYSDDAGAPQYKVSTPHKIPDTGRTSAISRVVDLGTQTHGNVGQGASEPGDEEGLNAPKETQGSSAVQEARFASLATIDWHITTSSVITFRGEEHKTSEWLRKEGLRWYGPHRVFTALDGKDYRWILQNYTSELKTNDASEELAARFHPKKPDKWLATLLKSHPAPVMLEIRPSF